jgi:hypothetical protein
MTAPDGADPAPSRSVWALVAMGAVLTAAVASLALRSGTLVPDLPVTEDAYYAFSVSRNLVQGHGPSVDGTHLTNGFQPLFTVLTAPLFLLGEVVAVRALILVQATIFAVTAVTFGRIVRDASNPRARGNVSAAAVIGAVLYLAAGFVMRTHLNGLETGFLLFLYVIFWRRFQRLGLTDLRAALHLGVIAGLLVLTRIDAGFFLVAFLAVFLVTERDRREALRKAAVVGITSLVISLPWWIFNLVEFGSLLPTSGSAQQKWALDPSRFDNLLRAIAQASAPWVYFGDRFKDYWPIAAIAAAGGVAVWILVIRRTAPVGAGDRLDDPESSSERRRGDLVACSLAGSGLLLGVWYTLSSWATHFYPRYLALLALPALYLWARLAVGLWARFPKVTTTAIAGIAGVGLIFTASFHAPSTFSGNEMYRDQLPVVRSLVPPDDQVAAGQSGTLGYFRDHVVNLDGKVNIDALRRRDDMAAYLSEMDVHWLCDWPNYVKQYLGPDPESTGWKLAGRRGNFRCYHRE